MKPTLCTACPFWVTGCSIEPLYAIGYLKACPNLSGPVLNEYGYVMNPPWDEKYLLEDGHVFLFPECSKGDDTGSAWTIRYTIFKTGAGSCGSVSDPMYLMAYKKAIEEICADRRITVADRIILENLFSDCREFSMREESIMVVEKPVIEEAVVEKPVIEPEIEFVVDESRFGDQMELFG